VTTVESPIGGAQPRRAVVGRTYPYASHVALDGNGIDSLDAVTTVVNTRSTSSSTIAATTDTGAGARLGQGGEDNGPSVQGRRQGPQSLDKHGHGSAAPDHATHHRRFVRR
jgi:hypothetical protein